jgi:hypothetical protein
MLCTTRSWIRTPFGTIGGYILFIQVMYNGHEFSYKENLACLTVGGLVAWNALFFGRRVRFMMLMITYT